MKGLPRILVAGTALAALLAVALLALLALAPALDASPWREAIASRASAALGRQVILEGPLEVRLARTAEVRIGGIRVLDPPGFAAREFAVLRDAHARVDAFALLRGRLVLRSVEASAARVRLERAADGRANWTFGEPATSVAPPDAAGGRIAVEIARITLRGLTVDFEDALSGTHRRLDLDELTGVGGWTEPIAIAVRGRTARGSPYDAALAGGPARLLAASDASWPFALDATAAGVRLHAAGSVTAGARSAEFEIGAGADNFEDIEQLLGTKLPKLGAAAISGQVAVRSGAIELAGLRGVVGDSVLAGHVGIDTSGARVRATGDLAIAELDLRPFMGDPAAEPRRAPSYEDLADNATPLRGLVPFDLALALRVGRLAGVAFEVRDATLEVTADESGVRAPMAATVAGIPFTGYARLDTGGATPAFALEVGARDTRLGERALEVVGLEGVEGGLERVAFRAGGRGETVGAVVRDLSARLELEKARLSYGHFAGGRAIGLALDALVLEAAHGERLRGSARGMLLGKRVSFTLRGRELSRILRDGVLPVELAIAGAGVKARIEGGVERSDVGRGAGLKFHVAATGSGDIAEWLGFAPQSRLPVVLRGEARREPGGWHLRDTRIEIGRSVVIADARRAVVGGRTLTFVKITSPLLDLAELATLKPPVGRASQGARELALDVPLLPQSIELADADIDLAIERIVLRRTELTGVGFDARIRDGYLPPAPFRASVAAVRFDGTLGIDLRSDAPEVVVELSAVKVDVGALLRALAVAENIDAHADVLHFRLAGRGGSLDELAEHSSFAARMAGGDFALRGPAGKTFARIEVREGVVAAAPGQPVDARLEGAIEGTDVAVQLTTGALADFARDARRVPLAVAARAAGATLRIEGEAGLPLGRSGQLAIALAGERLDSLSGLARVELPPWGPWSLAGPITMTATAYEVPRLALSIGTSQLTGRGTLDLGGARPRLDVRVEAARLQLDDFPFSRQADAGPAASMSAESLRGYASRATTRTQRVLDAAFLRRFDAFLDVKVKELFSGADRLADGTLRAQLVEGELYLGPAEVNVLGGTAKLAAAYDPSEGGIKLALGAYIEHFDYAILARRRWPDSDVSGLISMNLELTSTARSLNMVLASASGRIDIAVAPQNLGARQVDLWVVNLFRTLLPVLDHAPASVVNCIVGRFDLVDGKLTEDLMVIDTSRIRVWGTGGIDFRTEKIDFRFRPRTKRLQPLSLETPVRVTGTLTDFSVGVSPEDVFAAIARFFTSVIVVPLQTLFRGPIPVDGSDVCTDPLRLIETGPR
ncbi:MAG: AsmA family protein [Burkholderiales bacterium]|nr:AsmA family protein [Burkholderiales bacterium]